MSSDWRELVADPDVELFDNSGPNNLHAEPTIAAAEAGKHVFCEKPLGRTADESYEIWQRVQAAGVKHMTAFNYRFVPAVRLARQMIEAGELGEIHHFRGRYLQEWGTTTDDAWRFHADAAGSGALGDLGAHVIDLARYLVGEITAVSAEIRTFFPGREVDDSFEAVASFANGAVGTIEATRFAAGRKNAFSWEINGSKGSLGFDLERLNELQHSEGTRGFRTILVSQPDHPVLGMVVARGAHDRLGAHLRARDPSSARPRSRTATRSRRTARRSRTATGRRRSAMLSSARPGRGGARRSSTAREAPTFGEQIEIAAGEQRAVVVEVGGWVAVRTGSGTPICSTGTGPTSCARPAGGRC